MYNENKLNSNLNKVQNFIKTKKPAFILLLTMLIISSISLIVMSVSLKVFVSRNLISTLFQRHERNILLANSISTIQALLSKINESSSNKEENKENLQFENSEKNSPAKVANKGSTDNADSEVYKRLFSLIWTDFYKFNTIKLTVENDGINAQISYYLMCEDGKIPINNFIKKLNELNKKNNNDSTKTENDSLNNAPNKSITPDSQEDKNSTDSNKESTKNSYLKKINEFIKKLKEKSSALKFTYSELIENNSNKDGNKNLSSSTEKEFLTEIYKKYESYNNKLLPDSLWSLFGNMATEKEIYQVNKTSENNNEKNKLNFKTGDIISTYDKKCSIWYLTPALLEAFNKTEKFELTEENKKKIIESGSKLILEKNNSSIQEIWSKLYSIPYPTEIFKDLNVEEIFTTEKLPSNITAIIEINQDDSSSIAFVVFEKTTFFGKNSNVNYFVKQIHYLHTR